MSETQNYDFKSGLVKYITSLYPKKNDISLSEPLISKEDQKKVLRVLEDNMISSFGPEVSKFEELLTDYCGTQNVIAIINGTAALHLALKALGIGENDEVITQSYSYIAVPNAINYAGAEPVFIDNDLSTLGINPENLEKIIQEQYGLDKNHLINKKTGKKLKAVIAVYAFGQAYDVYAVKSVCDKYKINLIEDAAEALGTYINGKHAGSFGKLGVLSFNGNKICSSGSGGAIICNDNDLSQKIKHLSTTAKTVSKMGIDFDQLGYNYRMANINAALGLSQLNDIDKKLKAKTMLRRAYKRFLDNYDYKLIGNENTNNWLNSILLNSKEEKKELINLARKFNIQMESSWVYLPETRLYKNAQVYNAANAKDISDRIVQLPGSLDFEF
ncbi:aminotransferase class I/II-fold pyridoxal phosphate-dependent enzyme [Hyphobacterium sp. CCMP332]|nr:aminotransferase class I/II-fold pyridoxal phosphate-dependent enzyme [Hyphobacterium sp. CCMP332]